MERSEVLRPILALFKAPRYLEIGVRAGETFFALSAVHKVAVDPNFEFDVEAARAREPHSQFFEAASDRFFGELIEPDAKFDVIYIDGLHTFEQTLRDFCNSVCVLADRGVIVIDDVVPNSYASSLPNLLASVRLKEALGDPDRSWMGDVYRLVFFIDTFFQQLDFATVIENHGQLVVWRQRRAAAYLKARTVEEIATLPFESTRLEREALRFRNYGEIIEALRLSGSSRSALPIAGF